MKISMKFVFALLLFATVLRWPAKANAAPGTCNEEQAQYYVSVCTDLLTAECQGPSDSCGYNCVQEFKPYEANGIVYVPDPDGSATAACENNCAVGFGNCMQGIGACVGGYCAGQ